MSINEEIYHMASIVQYISPIQILHNLSEVSYYLSFLTDVGIKTGKGGYIFEETGAVHKS